MHKSVDHILITHTGGLPRGADIATKRLWGKKAT